MKKSINSFRLAKKFRVAKLCPDVLDEWVGFRLAKKFRVAKHLSKRI